MGGASPSNLSISFLTTGANPDYVATADLNGDGFQDLIVANFTDGTLSIFLGVGDGTFNLPTTVAVGAGPVWIATGNFHQNISTDPSTNVDIVVANQNAKSLSILLGNGDGTFQAPTTVATGNLPSSIAVADFNNDGISDLAVVNQGDNTIGIYLGKGDGTFSTPTLIATGAKPTSIVAAAFDSSSNALIDLAITNSSDNTLEVFLGRGDGTFFSGTRVRSVGRCERGRDPRSGGRRQRDGRAQQQFRDQQRFRFLRQRQRHFRHGDGAAIRLRGRNKSNVDRDCRFQRGRAARHGGDRARR